MSDKAYRLSGVILLTRILEVFGQFYKPSPSEACLTAIEATAGVATFIQRALKGLPDEYQAEVYDRADHKNQQMFLSNEQIFRDAL